MAISDEELARAKGISVEQVRLLRQSRGSSNETLAYLPDQKLRRALRRLNYPDLPRARQAFRAKQARDDAGTIPAGALAQALGQVQTLRARSPQKPRVAGLPSGRTVQP